jgi:hypothetical protein
MTDDTMFPGQATRASIIKGLRQLADYLHAHPAIPVAPYGWDLLVSSHRENDTEGTADIDRIAAILGVPIRNDASDSGHYIAARAFGPITYQAFHIPASRKAAYRAHMTCAGRVIPDHTDTDADDTGADDPPQAA